MNDPRVLIQSLLLHLASMPGTCKCSCKLTFFVSRLKTGAGVILCIERAIARSGVSREDVNYINAHATSTPAGDLREYEALIRCFGQNPEVTLVYGIFLLFIFSPKPLYADMQCLISSLFCFVLFFLSL